MKQGWFPMCLREQGQAGANNNKGPKSMVGDTHPERQSSTL